MDHFADAVRYSVAAAQQQLTRDMNRSFFGGSMGGLGISKDISIEKVENGFVVNVNYRKYVFRSFKQVSKFLEEHFSGNSEAA